MNPGFGASNGTQLDIGLFVNGRLVVKLAPGQSLDPSTAAMPPLPWTVGAAAPPGASWVDERRARAGHVHPGRGGGESCSGALILVTLVCGQFEFCAGTVPSIPAPVPGAGDPCVP